MVEVKGEIVDGDSRDGYRYRVHSIELITNP
jgi:hypothetical protein